jgi:hypothetical protein
LQDLFCGVGDGPGRNAYRDEITSFHDAGIRRSG